MHNDGEVIDNTFQRLINYADKLIEDKQKWSVIFTNYDVLCAYSTDCVNAIGKWGDSKWLPQQQSGYYLDIDYYRRMSLSEYKKHQLENTNVLHNEISNTIKDPIELKNWENQRAIVENHYIKKWGGKIGEEKINTLIIDY
jgi:hypothetical protein